ncbi:hypothetical protein KDA_19810 [Dictyobacter alpinus]|uniref:Uncharacterized protein n=1 Tax=Dictyobacter alpinus TaxID=2014873 RepID=A0A402B574_9CHLR|nr:hypothetical protein KDA_19810 [Dictyobacter alpinus]
MSNEAHPRQVALTVYQAKNVNASEGKIEPNSKKILSIAIIWLDTSTQQG